MDAEAKALQKRRRALRKQRARQARYEERQEEKKMSQPTESEELTHFEALARQIDAKARQARPHLGIIEARQAWLDAVPDNEWDSLAGCKNDACRANCCDWVIGLFESWDRVAREIKERDVWSKRLFSDARRPKDAHFCYDFTRFAEKEIRKAGVKLDDPAAVDYFFDVLLPKSKDTSNAQVWHGRLSNYELDLLERNIAAEEQERAEGSQA